MTLEYLVYTISRVYTLDNIVHVLKRSLNMDGMRLREREGERKSGVYVCMSEIDIERERERERERESEREKGPREGYWGKNTTDTRTICKS